MGGLGLGADACGLPRRAISGGGERRRLQPAHLSPVNDFIEQSVATGSLSRAWL